MGNSQPESQKFSELNWRRVSAPTADIHLFQNANDKNIHIEQHHIETISEEDFEKIKEFSYLRKNNPRWVSALYFEDARGGSEFCTTKYQADLYLESIPIRLCNIKSIPFPDALHLYDQALNGYSQFARSIGCFAVENDYIGINQRGVVKVWAGARWELVGVKGGSVSQEDMVRSIVYCLEECIDRNSLPPQYPSIANFLYRSSRQINFESALGELKNYAIATNMGSIPTRLNSIENTLSYDNQRQRSDQLYQSKQLAQPPPEVVRYFSPQPYGPTSVPLPPFAVRREQPMLPEQIDAMRRVNSLSTLPVYGQPPQFINHQQVRTVGPGGPAFVRPTIDRSLSNPQLLSGPQSRPPSSKQIPLQMVQVTNPPVNNRVFVSEVRPAGNPFSSSRANPMQGPVVKNQVEQNKQFTIIKQQQLAIIPPSQTEIPRQPVQQIQPAQTSPRREGNERGSNEQQSQSIIMQLSKSQTNNPFNPEPKYFNAQKNSEIVDNSFKRDYPTPILNENSQSSLKGTPAGQYENKYFTPIGANKKEISNLNSIEEVQTEHYWKDYSSKNSEIRPEKLNSEPYSLSNLKENYKADTKQVSYNKYIIDSNDGKSSDDFLQKLKAISSGVNISSLDNTTSYDFSPKKYDFTSTRDYDFGGKDLNAKAEYKLPNLEYNYSFEKKKDVGFSDGFNSETAIKESSSDINYKPYEFKPTSTSSQYNFGGDKTTDFSDLYSKYTAGSASYNGGIDPEIWADLQKNKQ